MGQRAVMAMLRFYKKYLSAMIGATCKFEPSCSMYMYEAVERYGAIKGVWMGLKRLARCQPCTRGGYDPVP